MGADELTTLGCANLSIVEDIYLKFQANPTAVDPSWREFFERYDDDVDRTVVSFGLRSGDQSVAGDLRISDLISAYRTYGHLLADVNPIATRAIQEPHELKLSTIGFREDELSQHFPTRGLLPSETAPLSEIIDTLRQIYCRQQAWNIWACRCRKWSNGCNNTLSLRASKPIFLSKTKSKSLIISIVQKFSNPSTHQIRRSKALLFRRRRDLIPMLNAVIERSSNLGLQEFVVEWLTAVA